MGKIGVGIGEDFPVDDADGNQAAGAQNGGDDRAEFEAWKRRRDDERRYYEDKRRRHEEWHQRKEDFKDRVKAAARDFGDDARAYHGHDRDWHGGGHMSRFWPMGVGIALLAIAIPVLILAFFFSLISAAFKAPFVILAIVAIGAAIFMARHRHRHYGYGYSGHHDRDHGRYCYYTDADIQSPPRGTAQPQSPKRNGTPPITTPPAPGA
jgi:hypothetical protein